MSYTSSTSSPERSEAFAAGGFATMAIGGSLAEENPERFAAGCSTGTLAMAVDE